MTKPAVLFVIFFTTLSLFGQTGDTVPETDPEETTSPVSEPENDSDSGNDAEQEKDEKEDELDIDLSFERTEWKIGMESFSGDVSARYSYLKSSIPDLIKRELDQADTHILTEPEKSRYRKDIISVQKLALLNKLRSSYSTRDNYLFSSSATSDSKEDTDESIDELHEMLKALDSFSQNSIKTAQMLPVQWASGSQEGGLLEGGQYVPAVVCSSQDLDFLVFGEIREIDEYFRMDVSAYDRSTDEELLVYTGTAPLDLVDQLAVEAAGELRSIILGRAWAAVRIETNDPDALIYSDGTLIGVGSASVNTLEPGPILFEAVGVDNSYWSREEELTALEETFFSAELSESEKDFVKLTSTPEGADVYIGARWAGTTPLNLPRYKERNIWVTLRSEGYYENSFEISSGSPDTMNMILEEEGLTRLEEFDLRKKEFYRSLGIFSLSVAAPMISKGISENYRSAEYQYFTKSQDTTIDAALKAEYIEESEEMYRRYFISEGVFWGTIGVSSGLLVNVFVKLSRYIKAAEALAE